MEVPQHLNLPKGDYDLDVPVVGWLVHASDEVPAAAKLIAEVQSLPRDDSALNRGRTATSLAIRMDAWVAIDLYLRLGHLIQRMGWPLPK
jgi:hypothetical protein